MPRTRYVCALVVAAASNAANAVTVKIAGRNLITPSVPIRFFFVSSRLRGLSVFFVSSERELRTEPRHPRRQDLADRVIRRPRHVADIGCRVFVEQVEQLE